MGHDITSTDQMFSVRQPTWHGLGVILDDHPTRAEAQPLVHPWEPETQPLYRRVIREIDHATQAVTYPEAPDYRAVVRNDTQALLGVVSDGYVPVSNDEMWDIAEAIQGDASDVRFETGGSLRGGSKVWVLLRLEEPLVVQGDPNGATLPYYTLQNSHDGTGAFRGQATMTRIVCANTAQIADMDARAHGTEFTFRHSKNVRERIEDARQALAGWRTSLDAWHEQSLHMLGLTTDEDGVEAFLDHFIPEPEPGTASKRVMHNVGVARSTWRSLYDGPTGEGIKGSAYGLVQASIEYAEHFRKARTSESRFRRSFLDRNQVTQHAVRLALEVTS